MNPGQADPPARLSDLRQENVRGASDELTSWTRSLRQNDWVRTVRVHHWAKNVLIFVPLVLSHDWSNVPALLAAMLGLVCLLLVTSATYIINDIVDVDADRQHWAKTRRAIASGRIRVPIATTVATSLLLLGGIGAIALSLEFAAALGTYLLLTLAYSFRLKRVPLLDTLIIGVLFTMRIIMGTALTTHVYSEWLLTFSVFFFFSLALAKRHTEIVRSAENVSNSLSSRGYKLQDCALTLAFGVASSIASLVIMVLFIVNELQQRETYQHPKALWFVPLVLSMWVGRIWLLAHRGDMNDDPVSFALRDKTSLLLGFVVAMLFVASL